MDHVTRPSVILEFTEAGETTQSTPANYTGDTPGVVPLADGRFLIEDLIAGKKRLLIGGTNVEFVPFLTSDEESAFPVAPAGMGAIAFRIGPPNHREIAVASLRDRRVIHRMAVNANEVRSLAASPGGDTIYYASGGFIWAVSVGHGEPRRLLQGDSVALNPAGSDLYVKQNGMNPIRLVRVPGGGGQAQEITIPGSIRLSQERLTPTAVDGRGRIVVEVASPGSFYYGTSIIDPSRSIATRIPLNFDGDVWGPGWMASGHISAFGAHLNASLWHYQKIGLGAPPGR
jgi:hypothetical protein